MINKFIGQGNISFKTDKKGKVYCYLEIRYFDENDKEHRKYIRGNDVRDACAKGDKFINDTLIEISQRDTNIALNKTFNEFCTTYLQSIYKHTVKESTYITALRTFRNQVSPYIGHLKIRNIDSLVIANLINTLVEKEYSLSTIKKAYQLVDGCFDFGVKSRLIQFNPVNAVSIPKSIKKPDNSVKFFNSDEMEAIREKAIELTETGKIKYGYVIMLLLYSGMRIGEALALKWENIDFENNEIRIYQTIQRESLDEDDNIIYSIKIQDSTKSENSTRTIYLHKYAKESLLKLWERRNSEYVISTSKGKPASPSRINKNLKTVLEYCNINSEGRTGVHTLRHSFATYLTKEKMSSESLAVYLGHSDDRITKQFYVHDKANTAKEEWKSHKCFQDN